MSDIKGSINVIYRTLKGTIYPLVIGYAVLPSAHIPVDKELTLKACKEGCGLYGLNGGCPPFSPHFKEICGTEILILYARINTCNYPPRVLHGSYYTRWVFVETFMTSLTNRVGKSIAKLLNGYFLSSGNCHVCRPKRCAVKDGHKCRKPVERTYSLESTGVLVIDLMKNCFNLDLQWWKKDIQDYIPEFMVKVIGIARKEFFNSLETKSAILNSIQNDRIEIREKII